MNDRLGPASPYRCLASSWFARRHSGLPFDHRTETLLLVHFAADGQSGGGRDEESGDHLLSEQLETRLKTKRRDSGKCRVSHVTCQTSKRAKELSKAS